MKCKICGCDSMPAFKERVLNKYDVQYYLCPECGFLQTEEPHWLTEAYNEAINSYDTGILDRNNYLSRITAVIIYFFFNSKGKFLDFAGGYGILTRLMRDYGFDFYWNDPYTQNLVARGFEYSGDTKDIELITSFESFEHFVKPIDEIEGMLKISKNILFSTQLLPEPMPKPSDWWYYGFQHGQHIAFYNEKTLRLIAGKYQLKFYSINDFIHLLTPVKINPILLKTAVKLSKLIYPLIIRGRMKSKTFSDMNDLIKKRAG